MQKNVVPKMYLLERSRRIEIEISGIDLELKDISYVKMRVLKDGNNKYKYIAAKTDARL